MRNSLYITSREYCNGSDLLSGFYIYKCKNQSKHVQNIHSLDDYFRGRGDVTISSWNNKKCLHLGSLNIFICEATRGPWNAFKKIRPIKTKDKNMSLMYLRFPLYWDIVSIAQVLFNHLYQNCGHLTYINLI